MGHEHHHQRRDRAHEELGAAGGEGRALRMRTTVENGQVADHLLALAHALRAGGGTLRSGGQTVVLRAGETVDLEVQAGEEGTHSVVRLALRWRTPVPQADLEITPGVHAPAARSADPTTHAHDVGLVHPGDAPVVLAMADPAPASIPIPVGGDTPRGRKGTPERPPEA